MTKRETFFAILALMAGMLWGVAMAQPYVQAATRPAAIREIEQRLQWVRNACKGAGGTPDDIVNNEIVTAVYCDLWTLYQRPEKPAPPKQGGVR